VSIRQVAGLHALHAVLVYILSLGMAAEAGDAPAGSRQPPGWEHANATLLEPLPLFNCGPDREPGRDTDPDACRTNLSFRAWQRVRITAVKETVTGSFYSLQFVEDGPVRSAWAAVSDPDDILVDPDSETVLPRIDQLASYDKLLPGTWKITSWDMSERNPYLSGYLRIDARRDQTFFPGKLHLDADMSRNHDGRRRRVNELNIGRFGIDQEVQITVRGSILLVESKLGPTTLWRPVHMALYYGEGRLQGHGGTVSRRYAEWSELPRISFTKIDVRNGDAGPD